VKPFIETEFNGIGGFANLRQACNCADLPTFQNGKRSMQETAAFQGTAAFTAVLGAAIALIAAYSLWTLRGRK
jgi:hypothetical protein